MVSAAPPSLPPPPLASPPPSPLEYEPPYPPYPPYPSPSPPPLPPPKAMEFDRVHFTTVTLFSLGTLLLVVLFGAIVHANTRPVLRRKRLRGDF